VPAYLDLVARHAPVARASAMSDLADSIAYHLDRAGLPVGDADLDEFVDDLPCVAWDWAGTALARRRSRSVSDALEPMVPDLPRLAALGSAGLLDERERTEALDLGIAILRRILDAAPNLQGWRHLAWIADYAETIARPRLIGRTPVPEDDADALVGLAR
jgi:hypothetical protein